MKLTDYKNEDAIDLLADILEPLAIILADDGMQKIIIDSKATRIQAVQYLLKKHPKQIMQIMARLEDTPVEKYEMNILTLPKKLLEMMNDKELISFFRSQGQMMVGNTFGSAMENTEETEKA